MEPFALSKLHLTQYLFFTGKGGVGKTSTACAVATSLADSGNRVLLVSTDPASNLQDVFAMELYSKPTPITEVPGLSAANLDPIEAAAEYRESVIAPYRGVLPQSSPPDLRPSLAQQPRPDHYYADFIHPGSDFHGSFSQFYRPGRVSADGQLGSAGFGRSRYVAILPVPTVIAGHRH